MEYDLPIQEEKVKPHQITTLHMVCALAFIVTGAIITIYNYTIPIWGGVILIAGLALVTLVMTKNKWVVSLRVNQQLRIVELLISIPIALYSFYQHWKFPAGIFSALSAALLFALYWERTAGSPLFVHFDKEGIRLPSTSRRKFKPWTEVEQVIVRFGTLTIDCTDNSLFQWMLATVDVDTELFEMYCKTQFEENRGKRRKNDW